MKIIVTDHVFGGLRYEESFARRHNAVFEEHACKTPQDAAEALHEATIVFNSMAHLDETALARMKADGIVIRYGVGVDNVDLDAATGFGIAVCNVPDYGATAVADHAIAFFLALSRRLHEFDKSVKSGKWGARDIVPNLPDLSEMTVGLLGFGRIAQEVAKRLAVFGCTTIAHDPCVDARIAESLQVQLVGLDDLLSRSNALSLHAPLIDSTRRIIDARSIALMPEGAVLINTSRGGLIEEAAVFDALRSGKLAGAALDVFEAEPPTDPALLSAVPNLLTSPHTAFYSNKSLDNLQRMATEEAERFVRGEALRCRVN